jgi:pseudaminic acid synthase
MLGKINKPFFVAEISANHNGSIKNAKKLIKAAKIYGADAVKLQTYTPNSMTVNSKKKYFQVKSGLWQGYNLWDLYKRAQTPYGWHKKLFEYSKRIGIKIFSTPFDESAVDFLEKLNCPLYKVASYEMMDLPLIKKIATTKKHIIISTGMASFDEISYTFNQAKKFGAKKISLLYCVSNYPSKTSDFNLNNIKIMKKKFKCEIGFSDHSKDSRIASAAANIGATIIEKHISLKDVEALDSEFSISGEEILNYKKVINNPKLISKNSSFYKKLLGKKKFFRNKSEDKSKKFRRSIFVVKNLKKGDVFTKNNIRKIRPGYGLSPIYYEKILGKICSFQIKANEPLTKKLLKRMKIKI